MRLFPVLALALALAAPAFAAESPVKLYKAIGSKEDVVIGLSAAEIREMSNDSEPKGPNDIGRRPVGEELDLEMIGDRLVGVGHLKAWQYGPRRGSDGSPEWAPLRRIVLFGAHVHRLEVQMITDRIVAPPK